MTLDQAYERMKKLKNLKDRELFDLKRYFDNEVEIALDPSQPLNRLAKACDALNDVCGEITYRDEQITYREDEQND